MKSEAILRCVAVASGGAIGSLARYGLSIWGASLGTRLPWGTMAANLAGCLAMGLVMQLVVERAPTPEWVRVLVAVGLLGGLTTFSSFSYESFWLLRQGHVGAAALYMFVSVVGGLGAAGLGWAAASALPGGNP